jgi:purine-binding chemotaxis protein CheW
MNTEEKILVVRAGRFACALPLTEVTETMRELPCQPCVGAPSWVRGASIVRGVPTPVVDLASFLGGRGANDAGRLVTVRHGDTRVALRVDSVVGIRVRSAEAPTQSSRLLEGVSQARREELATLDGELLSLLDLGTLLPDDFQIARAEDVR